jgi:D-alanyl-D-alanine carboxypeptidase/D-alanyl-D-alanine-endopeptidase (penicillin-binding protein 4)
VIGPRALTAAALALAVLAACGHRPAERATAQATPIAAVGGAPAWSAGDVRALQAKLRTALSASALATSGVAIVDAGGRTLFARRERVAQTPASTFKLLVGAAALTVLGPSYRFETTFESVAEPHDGALEGDLFLVGNGDPELTRDDLRGGVGVVARAGVRYVHGAVIADAGAFSGPEINAGWDPGDLQYGYAAGTSALALDQGTVEFHLVPTVAGAPARVFVVPASDAVRVRGGVATSYTTLLTIQRDAFRNDFTFSGTVAAEQSFWRPLIDLPRYAALVARSMLRERGIRVDDSVRIGTAPMLPLVLWRHRSPPLLAIVHRMFVESNNHFAEQLLRAVGATHGTGSESSGGRAEREVLVRDGVPQDGLRIVDGSGLAASDRVAPLTLALLLARVAEEPGGAAFVATLPRAGIEGTVRGRRLRDARGRVRAKSGHIRFVNALAGYVQTRHHGRVAFAIVVNDRRADDEPVDRGIDRALDLLSQN